jgi:hypothetical protein
MGRQERIRAIGRAGALSETKGEVKRMKERQELATKNPE